MRTAPLCRLRLSAAIASGSACEIAARLGRQTRVAPARTGRDIAFCARTRCRRGLRLDWRERTERTFAARRREIALAARRIDAQPEKPAAGSPHAAVGARATASDLLRRYAGSGSRPGRGKRLAGRSRQCRLDDHLAAAGIV